MPDTSLYFTSICSCGTTDVVLGGHLVVEKTEPTGTSILAIRNEEWEYLETAPAVVAGLAFDKSRNRLLAIGRGGDSFMMDRSGANMKTGRIPVRGPTYLNNVQVIGDRFCVYGGSNQFIVGDGESWTQADEGIFREFVVGELHAIYAALALETGAVIVAGRQGFVAMRMHDVWCPLDPPMNTSGYGLESLGHGRFVLVGSGGLFLVADTRNVWYDLTGDLNIGVSIWDIKKFDESIYLGIGQELIVVKETSELKFEIIERRRMEVNRFCANEYLWCIGGELVERFDGSEWRTFECPVNS